MALKQASTAHPIEAMRHPTAPTAGERETKKRDPAKKRARSPQRGKSRPAGQSGGVVDLHPQPESDVSDDPQNEPVLHTVPTGLTLPELPPLGDMPVGVARHERSLRAKREYAVRLTVDDAQRLRTVWKVNRPTYRRLQSGRDPGGVYQLTLAAFTSAAVNWALDHHTMWVEGVPNDARNSRSKVPRTQIGLTWPIVLIDRLNESWELLDAAVNWPAGYTLTKSNLVAAAIRWACTDVDGWLGDVTNDDRLNEPVAGDKRLNPNK